MVGPLWFNWWLINPSFYVYKSSFSTHLLENVKLMFSSFLLQFKLNKLMLCLQVIQILPLVLLENECKNMISDKPTKDGICLLPRQEKSMKGCPRDVSPLQMTPYKMDSCSWCWMSVVTEGPNRMKRNWEHVTQTRGSVL